MEAMLTSDLSQLAVAIRPFRAIHHLREAKILDVTTRTYEQYAADVKARFGTEIKQISLERVEAAYQAVSDEAARAEADRWMAGAVMVVEPTDAEIVKSCKLGLAFEKLLDEEDATVMTVDCYGTMWDKTIKLPAYPCIGFSRLNNMGYGGICESDLQCALTHIIFQGLVGRPGFISDPTVDESTNSIVLAHCMGTVKMEGPGQSPARYKLRTVMERQEGVVPQVFFPDRPPGDPGQVGEQRPDRLFHRHGHRCAGCGARLPHQDRCGPRRQRGETVEELGLRTAPRDVLREHPQRPGAILPIYADQIDQRGCVTRRGDLPAVPADSQAVGGSLA